MSKTRGQKSKDFREFVFIQTGGKTDLGHLTPMDVYNNLNAEADRLLAIADLLSTSGIEPDTRAIKGLAHLLTDIERRMRAVLEHSIKGSDSRE